MLLRSQTLPFLLFQTSVSILSMFSPLRLKLALWFSIFLDFQTGICFFFPVATQRPSLGL